jgi:hypothetical protein
VPISQIGRRDKVESAEMSRNSQPPQSPGGDTSPEAPSPEATFENNSSTNFNSTSYTAAAQRVPYAPYPSSSASSSSSSSSTLPASFIPYSQFANGGKSSNYNEPQLESVNMSGGMDDDFDFDAACMLALEKAEKDYALKNSRKREITTDSENAHDECVSQATQLQSASQDTLFHSQQFEGHSQGDDDVVEGHSQGDDGIAEGHSQGDDDVVEGHSQGDDDVVEGHSQGDDGVAESLSHDDGMVEGHSQGGDGMAEGHSQGDDGIAEGHSQGDDDVVEGHIQGDDDVVEGHSQGDDDVVEGHSQGDDGVAEGGRQPVAMHSPVQEDKVDRQDGTADPVYHRVLAEHFDDDDDAADQGGDAVNQIRDSPLHDQDKNDSKDDDKNEKENKKENIKEAENENENENIGGSDACGINVGTQATESGVTEGVIDERIIAPAHTQDAENTLHTGDSTQIDPHTHNAHSSDE